MTLLVEERLELLSQVLCAWPDLGEIKPTIAAREIADGSLNLISETLSSLLTSEFESGDLLSAFTGVTKVLSFDASTDRLTFKDASGETLQARFTKTASGVRLLGLKTECAICLGEQGETMCDACDGQGWI